MKKETKLILKGLTDNGVPFTKEIRTLDEVKSCGNFIVVCKNASTSNGLPQINGKSHSCFCCEAQLIITCCYPEDESQSNTAYGQTLTICDRETGTTHSYIRTFAPGKNNGKWSLWQMAATGDIEVISQNSTINESISKQANKLDSESARATARHFNYIGNDPFSQRVIDAGADKMIVAGYLDIEYEEGKAYCFSVANKNSNVLQLYKKDKDLPATEANVTHLYNFSLSKIDASPYYLAKATYGHTPKSWLIVDWENVKSYNSLYDYDGIALSPTLFKNSGLSSKINDQIDALNTISASVAELGSTMLSTIDRIGGVENTLSDIAERETNFNDAVVVNQFQTSEKIGSQLYSSSTFSGAAMYVGELQPFRYILSYFKAADWLESPKPITKMLLQIRQNDYAGEVLYSKFMDITIQPGEVKPVLFDLGEIRTFTGNLFIALRADTYATPMRPADDNYLFEPADGTVYPRAYYWINGNIDEADKGMMNYNTSNGNFYFRTYEELKFTSTPTEAFIKDVQERLNFNEHIEISLPDKITAVVGDTLQLFYRGMIKAVNPYNYDILVTCSKGKQTPRFFEYTPTTSDVGTTNFTLTIKDSSGNIVATKSCVLQTVAAAISPSTKTNILCLGDSNVAGGQWVKEAARRLTASDGTPVGNGFTNIEFCGSIKGGGAGWFGVGGWSWDTFTSAGAPAFRFYVTGVGSLSVGAVYSHNGYNYTIKEVNVTSGNGNILCETSSANNTPTIGGTLTKTSGSGDAKITFDEYVADAQNPLWNVSQNRMSFIPYANEVAGGQIDVVYTFLTWNGINAGMNVVDFANILARVKIFADTLHSEFPNAKLKLLGQNPPSLNGGMGANYGATGSGYADDYGMFRTILNMNEAYQEFANRAEYSSFVEFVNVSSQFDAENNMQSGEFAVNTRNSKKERRDTNGVHPSTEGYYQIADVVYRNFVANYCK